MNNMTIGTLLVTAGIMVGGSVVYSLSRAPEPAPQPDPDQMPTSVFKILTRVADAQDEAEYVMGLENFWRADYGLPPVEDEFTPRTERNVFSRLRWIEDRLRAMLDLEDDLRHLAEGCADVQAPGDGQ